MVLSEQEKKTLREMTQNLHVYETFECMDSGAAFEMYDNASVGNRARDDCKKYRELLNKFCDLFC